jgi:hypothetical protein
MYNLSFNEDGEQHDYFEIRCDDAEAYYGNELPFDAFNPSDQINDFCTFTYRENDEEENNALIGVSIQEESTVEEFLTVIYDHVQMMYDLDDDEQEEFVTACNGINSGNTNNEDFFKVCPFADGFGAEGIRLAYNPDFDILFMAHVNDEVTEFYGMFETERFSAYLDSYLMRFLAFFGNIFGGTTNEGIDTQLSVNDQTLLPLILQDEVTFSKSYIQKRGDKMVKGFVHTDAQGDYYTLEYTGISQNVRPLVLDYFNTENDLSLNYLVGEGKQIIQIINPKPQGYSVDENTFDDGEPDQIKDFAPVFDWRRLGPMLTFDTNFYLGPTYEAVLGNGVVDYGEECDTDGEGNTVFKFNNDSCSFWDSSYETGTVLCNNGVVNTLFCQ